MPMCAQDACSAPTVGTQLDKSVWSVRKEKQRLLRNAMFQHVVTLETLLNSHAIDFVAWDRRASQESHTSQVNCLNSPRKRPTESIESSQISDLAALRGMVDDLRFELNKQKHAWMLQQDRKTKTMREIQELRMEFWRFRHQRGQFVPSEASLKEARVIMLGESGVASATIEQGGVVLEGRSDDDAADNTCLQEGERAEAHVEQRVRRSSGALEATSHSSQVLDGVTVAGQEWVAARILRGEAYKCPARKSRKAVSWAKPSFDHRWSDGDEKELCYLKCGQTVHPDDGFWACNACRFRTCYDCGAKEMLRSARSSSNPFLAKRGV
eukprot:TRINITY_DN20007_c0_g1_i1.p1 TRINITY_DN20007_c0_g1~~TRINITY_DN20007_c0_g1_i1.p1  ORF type:complete len:347 (+),score=52.11 TRINITY_DN20007_c0_g1_i1:69-1043(+)